MPITLISWWNPTKSSYQTIIVASGSNLGQCKTYHHILRVFPQSLQTNAKTVLSDRPPIISFQVLTQLITVTSSLLLTLTVCVCMYDDAASATLTSRKLRRLQGRRRRFKGWWSEWLSQQLWPSHSTSQTHTLWPMTDKQSAFISQAIMDSTGIGKVSQPSQIPQKRNNKYAH